MSDPILTLRQLIQIEAAAKNTTDSPTKIAAYVGLPVSAVSQIVADVRGAGR